MPDSFMLVGMIGLLISFILTYYGSIDVTYGVTLGLFFGIMLLSSLISIRPELPKKISTLRYKAATDAIACEVPMPVKTMKKAQKTQSKKKIITNRRV